jgi:hypothetical protein
MPVYKHPYLRSRATDGLWCMAKTHNISSVGHMPAPRTNIDNCDNCTKKNVVVQKRLRDAGWLHPPIGGALPPPAPPPEEPLAGIWQLTQDPYNLLKFCTNPYNLLAVPEHTNPNIKAAVVYLALSWLAPIVMANR